MIFLLKKDDSREMSSPISLKNMMNFLSATFTQNKVILSFFLILLDTMVSLNTFFSDFILM